MFKVFVTLCQLITLKFESPLVLAEMLPASDLDKLLFSQSLDAPWHCSVEKVRLIMFIIHLDNLQWLRICNNICCACWPKIESIVRHFVESMLYLFPYSNQWNVNTGTSRVHFSTVRNQRGRIGTRNGQTCLPNFKFQLSN